MQGKGFFIYMTKSKVYGIATALLVGALIFLGIVWWMNGRDDTWLYATCAPIVISSFFPVYSPITERTKTKVSSTHTH